MTTYDAPPHARPPSGRAAARIKGALSAALLTLATIVGLRAGLSAPAISPVSPAAIAASQPSLAAPAGPRPAAFADRTRRPTRGRGRG